MLVLDKVLNKKNFVRFLSSDTTAKTIRAVERMVVKDVDERE